MRMTTAYAFVWISYAFAVSVGIAVTKSLMPLWALVIPGFISFQSGESSGE